MCPFTKWHTHIQNLGPHKAKAAMLLLLLLWLQLYEYKPVNVITLIFFHLLLAEVCLQVYKFSQF